MPTYHEDGDLNEDELQLRTQVFEAFPNSSIPSSAVAAKLEILHEGELDHLLGLDWRDLYANREQAIYIGDWYMLRDPGLTYYLPAFLLTTLGPVQNDLVEDLVEFLLTRVEVIRERLEPDELKVLCSFATYWIAKSVQPREARKLRKAICREANG